MPGIGSPEAAKLVARGAAAGRPRADPHRRFCPPGASAPRRAGGSAPRTARPSRAASRRPPAPTPRRSTCSSGSGLAATALCAVQERRPVAALAVDAAGLAPQPPPQPRAARKPLAGSRSTQTLAPPRLDRSAADRRGEGLQRIGLRGRAAPAARRSARASTSSVRSTDACRHQPRQSPPSLSSSGARRSTSSAGRSSTPSKLRKRRAQQPHPPAREPPARRPVAARRRRRAGCGSRWRGGRPSRDPALAGSELGGEAQHGVGLGVELVRRHDRDGTARSERAAGGDEAMRSQRGGDSDGAESEGRERGNRGEESIDIDARYEPPEGEQHRGGEDRQHRARIRSIATHHAPTFG